jgi:ABC-type branched-subunit amino acid transport system ATPase component
MPILQTIQLEKRFGGILAAQNVNLAVEPGARHALIGPNGAGKTTVINLLTGVLRPTGGRILLEGRDITGLLPHQQVRLGMARTFQINQLFLDLTPLESIGLVAYRNGSARAPIGGGSSAPKRRSPTRSSKSSSAFAVSHALWSNISTALSR